MLYYVEQKDGAWLVPENIGQTVIETVPGQPFEVNFQDLNVDGKIFFCIKTIVAQQMTCSCLILIGYSNILQDIWK